MSPHGVQEIDRSYAFAERRLGVLNAEWCLLAAAAALPAEALVALSARGDLEANRKAVGTLEKLHEKAPDDVPLFEAVLRARFFLAETPGLDDRTVHEEVVRIGLGFLKRHLGTSDLDFGKLSRTLGRLPSRFDGVIYWMTLSFGRTIVHRFVLSRMGAAKDFQRTLHVLAERSSHLDHSGPRRALAHFSMRAPRFLGGSKEEARKYAEAAVREAPHYLGNHVARARAALSAGEARSLVRNRLERALEADAERPQKERSPEARRALARAASLLAELKSP